MNAIRDKVYNQLKVSGMNVCLPGQKIGECKEPYVVVRNGGTIAQTKTTGFKIIAVTCRVPLGRLTDLDDMVAEVRTSLAGMRQIKPTGDVTAELINSEYKAHESTIEYGALCAI